MKVSLNLRIRFQSNKFLQLKWKKTELLIKIYDPKTLFPFNKTKNLENNLNKTKILDSKKILRLKKRINMKEYLINYNILMRFL